MSDPQSSHARSTAIDVQNLGESFALRARWVFPITAAPLENGVVSVERGRITALGQRSTAGVVELGNVALLPGFVNAHTHLEFSDQTAPLGRAGMAFPDWIRAVVSARRTAQATLSDDERRRARKLAVERGLAECRANGVTTVGEIATPGWPVECFSGGGKEPSAVIFQEVLGLSPACSDEQLAVARDHLNRARANGAAWRAALSPHAPYTVNPQLVERLCRLSAEAFVPVAMHLAESIEELELLRSHSGPLVDVLAELGAWHAGAIPRGIRPLDYLRLLATAHRALVIHGNFLLRDEIEFVAAHRDRLSVVYCPRTQAYFHAGEYPLRQLLAAGAHVAIGTDSRGSNPDLSLWEELRFLARRYADLDPATILRLGTWNAARALGVEAEVGSLEVGKRADFSVVALSPAADSDPYRLLVEGETRVVATFQAGQCRSMNGQSGSAVIR